MTMTEEATKICTRVVAKINAVSVKGMGGDEDVWKATTPAHDIFWEALIKWEAEGGDDNKAALREAAKDWIGAWREASVEYQAKLANEFNRGS